MGMEEKSFLIEKWENFPEFIREGRGRDSEYPAGFLLISFRPSSLTAWGVPVGLGSPFSVLVREKIRPNKKVRPNSDAQLRYGYLICAWATPTAESCS